MLNFDLVELMQLICPMCSTAIIVNPLKAGRFTPRCTKCQKPFVVTVTVQTVDEYKATLDKTHPSTLPMRYDPDSTFAWEAPTPSDRSPIVDHDATFTSQVQSRPVINDPDWTFASKPTESTSESKVDNSAPAKLTVPEMDITGEVNHAAPSGLHSDDKPKQLGQVESGESFKKGAKAMLSVAPGAVVAILLVPVFNLFGVTIPEVGPLKPTYLFAILGIVISVLGFLLLGRK